MYNDKIWTTAAMLGLVNNVFIIVNSSARMMMMMMLLIYNAQ